MSSSIMPPRRATVTLIPPSKKRRKAEPKIEEIAFNIDHRQDYLSGFHKRKVQRQKQAQAEAVKRGRDEKLAARKALREGRKADLERHVEAVNAVLKRNVVVESDLSESEAEEGLVGIQEEPGPLDLDEEYVDDDKFTTVTVEAVDVSRDGLTKVLADGEEAEDDLREKPTVDVSKVHPPNRDENGKRIWTKEPPIGTKAKSKKRQFRYESKADRKITRFKERGKGRKQAKERKGK